MARFFGHITIAVAMLMTACAGPVALGKALGDANGDTEVDVLDLQQVIAQVLAGQMVGDGDVNRDGKVDVLDFQAILSQAQQTASRGSETPPLDTRRGATVEQRAADVQPVRLAKVKVVQPEEGKSAASLGARPALAMHVASAKVERHLQNLSPHAPPVA